MEEPHCERPLAYTPGGEIRAKCQRPGVLLWDGVLLCKVHYQDLARRESAIKEHVEAEKSKHEAELARAMLENARTEDE